MRKLLLSLSFLTIAACDTTPDTSDTTKEEIDARGEVDHACREDGSCNAGLTCVENYCRKNCNNNFDCGNSCLFCDAGTKLCKPFPVGEKIGTCAGPHQQCNGTGNCECLDNFAGDNCDLCKVGWRGDDDCDECDAYHFGPNCSLCTCQNGTCNSGINGNGECTSCNNRWQGNNCDECQPGYYGASCNKCDCGNLFCDDGKNGTGGCYTCPIGWYGPNCDKCAEGYFGENCEKCTCLHGTCNDTIQGDGSCNCDSVWTGPNCDQCSNGHKTISSGCIECDPKFKGTNCDKCSNAHYSISSECRSCDPKFTGTNCDQCSNSHKTIASECLECDPKFIGENCDQCSNTHYSISSECKSCDPRFTGTNCDQCSNSHKTIASECLECNPKFIGTNCDQCRNSLIMGTDCDQCKNSLMTGENCNQCKNGGYGENCASYGVVKDQAGNKYKTVIINGQEWMAENYRRQTGTYYYPDNNSSNTNTYGLLYTWATASAANFCPSGWRLPTADEYLKLIGGTKYQSTYFTTAIQSTSWTSSASNSTGFGALPAGYRRSIIYFYGFGSSASFWSATPNGSDYAYGLRVGSGGADVSYNDVDYAFSVRCLRDSN